MREGLNIRLEKSGLENVSGASFRDLRGGDFPNLSALTENHGLIGIESSDGKDFTIVGLEYLYVMRNSGEIFKINLNTALKCFSSNALAKGKHNEYKSIQIESGKECWVKDKETMSALWNIALFISRMRK